MDDTNTALPRDRKNLLIDSDPNIPPNPEFLYPKVFEDRRKPPDVVLMRVGERHDFYLFQSARPQVRRDHVFSNVESRTHPARMKTSQSAAGIHQHRAPSRKRHKETVTLAHVQDRHLQVLGIENRREG